MSDDFASRRFLMLVTDAYGGHGGIAAYNRNFIEALAGERTVGEVRVLQRLAVHARRSLPNKVTIDNAALGGVTRFAAACLREGLSRRPYKRVHCGHLNLAPFAAAIAARRKIPWSLTIHGVEAWQPPRLVSRIALAGVDQVFSVSACTRGRFLNWAGLPPERVRIIPNTIRQEEFAADPAGSELKARYGLSGRTVLMTLGRLAGRARAKGFDEVLEVLPELARRIPQICYLVCGDGPDRARLEAKARMLMQHERVVFTGFVNEADKAAIYHLADVFVMPSRGEGFGIVLLEAMACGVPVIASVADGTREAVLNGRLGRLADPDDPAGLVDLILQTLKEPRGVPAGLSFFNFGNFTNRVHRAMMT